MIGPFPSGRFGLADAPKTNNTEMYGRDRKNERRQAILLDNLPRASRHSNPDATRSRDGGLAGDIIADPQNWPFLNRSLIDTAVHGLMDFHRMEA
ncbi:hypothetical protein [Sphingopyxis panaciterrae]